MGATNTCPACAGARFSPALRAREMFGGEPFSISRCTTCGLLRTDGDLGRAELAAYYHYAGGADAGGRFIATLEPLMGCLRRARLRAIATGRTGPGTVLDIGCGRGVALEALAARGWDVYGTELDAEVAATARARLGDRVQLGNLSELDFAAAPFDRICAWHVIEHLPDPHATLRRAAMLLAHDGRLLVALPNAASWQARLGGRDWLHLDVPRHRWHFTPATLSRLAERSGLRVTDIAHFSLEYGPYGLLQSLLARTGLGHVLFTDILRPGRRHTLTANPRFWGHVLLAAPMAGAAGLSLGIEALAALAGAGGAIVATLKHQ